MYQCLPTHSTDLGLSFVFWPNHQAFKERDPSCLSYCSALLYLKFKILLYGYHSLQTHRVAHALWNQWRKVLALALQSRVSEVFGVDIHPGIVSKMIS
ncbi:putative serine O-acetyltransferase [Helianthus annuus]|nr:putative serine O-acetyltransferase [Helianthus annuus]KAJ0484375.1 putative serine O-acetyltransferase [Helianthus annuus]KAJ0654928.1 putative serine O-acetyltransferase [Helianthus annuus]KAJ0852139.1 putative serine O-acetyltransferase [Helianthus annuus]